MKLVITYKKTLKDFVKNEVEYKFKTNLEEFKPSIGLIEYDAKKVILESSLIETVNKFIKKSNNLDAFNSYDFNTLIEKGESFRIKSSNKKVCNELGRIVQEQTSAEVNLEHPDKIIIVEELNGKFLAYSPFINDFNLTRRGYSVSNNEFITSDVARSLVDYSDWDDNGVLMDPYCHEGYVIIEAGLKALKTPPGIFRVKELPFKIEKPEEKEIKSELKCFARSMNDLKFAKQHVKLSGLSKFVRFGFHDLKYLDYKLGENKIDYLISALPKIDIEELFFQLEYIMKPNSQLVLYTSQDVKPSAEKYGFEIINKRKLGRKRLFKLRRKKE